MSIGVGFEVGVGGGWGGGKRGNAGLGPEGCVLGLWRGLLGREGKSARSRGMGGLGRRRV